ncbi:hypothetical protein AB4Y36_19440 [Paraburkholderia sp. BR10936]|uniref:hypothetical protein n=1 Tax=Paraburkholderia sp. BR10936 TaxID=3236993 RepID=UPI0034D1951A
MSYLFANNAAGSLAAGITSGATSLTLNTGQAAAFPNPTAPDVFYATITDAATQTQIEIVLVTQVSGSVFQITRAQDGTSALSWNAGDIVSMRATAGQLKLLNAVPPIGSIMLWSGAANAIPENWALCNGSNGTPNLQDKFVVGAGNSYAVGATGGATTATLGITNLPAHSHGVNDPTHGHGVNDPSHNHGLVDPGHYHTPPAGAFLTNASSSGVAPSGGGYAAYSTTAAALTGITLNPALTGISIANNGTGISIQNTGSGTAFSILPPYYALCYIMRVS